MVKLPLLREMSRVKVKYYKYLSFDGIQKEIIVWDLYFGEKQRATQRVTPP